jgi:hypothetical protein
LTGDLPDALHFRHFEKTKINVIDKKASGRVRIKESVKLEEPVRSSGGRVKLSS